MQGLYLARAGPAYHEPMAQRALPHFLDPALNANIADELAAAGATTIAWDDKGATLLLYAADGAVIGSAHYWGIGDQPNTIYTGINADGSRTTIEFDWRYEDGRWTPPADTPTANPAPEPAPDEGPYGRPGEWEQVTGWATGSTETA